MLIQSYEMKQDKEKWAEEVLGSMQGSSRAIPDTGLYARIVDQIEAPGAKRIPMRQWTMAAAAAVLILVLNVVTLKQYIGSNSQQSVEVVADNTYEQSLISNYKIYD